MRTEQTKMYPQSRQKSPVPHVHSGNAQTSMPRQRDTNNKDAQDKPAKHSLASHYTISRDETTFEISMKDKFHVLRTEPLSSLSTSDKTMVGYVEDVEEDAGSTIGVENTRRYPSLPTIGRKSRDDTDEIPVRATERSAVPPIPYYTHHTGFNSSDTIQNNTLESASGQSDPVGLLLQQIEALRGENERLRQQRKDKIGVNFKVLHCILDQGEEGNRRNTYLEKPYWTRTDAGFQLEADSPIQYPDAYIQYNSLAFVIYKYYSANGGIETNGALQQNKVPEPKPTDESIKLVSEDMVRAINAYMNNHEDLQKMFPRFSANEMVPAPYLWWYYHRDHPNALGNLSQPQTILMRNLTDWIDGNYSEFYSQLGNQFECGMVSAASIRFLIRPGDVLVRTNEAYAEAYLATSWLHEDKSVYEIYGLPGDSSKITGSAVPSLKVPAQEWELDAWSYSYDGELYKVETTLNIQLHVDASCTEIPIVNLGVFPLRFASRELREAIEQRGKIFWSCRHRKYVSYTDRTKNGDYTPGQRYMIDYPTYHTLHPSDTSRSAHMGKSKVHPTFMEQEVPSEPDIYLLPRTIHGFNMRRKKWEILNVDLIQEVSWDKQTFKHLVADPDTKDLVQALVTNKVAAERGTDLMQNKGNGLIILLHGGPGTGKTFTAESVAEIAEKPLYPVTCGDIGTKPEDVEKYLESVFHLGKIWGCVVLLDEAEVFLEQRSLNDLARNALVSVFLRALEYYDGILILTSNRVGTFDEAFKSRIQLSLHYEPLTQPRRAQIWRNFFSRLESLGEDNIDFDDVENYITEISHREMNGRQIRNVITTARQWALFQNRTMTASHLKYAIKVTSKFDTYIKDVKEGFSDEQIARGDGVR